MGMLEDIITKLPSKKFGNMEVFFDIDGKVKLIKEGPKYTYMLRKHDGGQILKTELEYGKCVDIKVEREHLWIIPNIDELDNTKTLVINKSSNNVARLLSEHVYKIVSYTILEDKSYKGCLFSNSVIYVVVENSRGSKYAVQFLVDEGVHGCDGNPSGHILGTSFQFTYLGNLAENGTLSIKL